MASRAKRKPAERYAIAFRADDPRQESRPFTQTVERRQSFCLEDAGECEAIGQTQLARDGLRRPDGSFRETNSFDDGAGVERHAGAGSTNRREGVGEHYPQTFTPLVS